ncbi:50S ribosomal protein L25 [Patescibacteria group bacterium]|nr:50S ribosomal protein L25 [Patescibacteria group bacterium]
MEKISIVLQKRDQSLKAKELLLADLIPIEFYGRGLENMSLQCDYQTFRRAYRAAGGNTVVELDVDGKKINALIHEVSFHPVTDRITHVDLINVRMDEEINTQIPLEFVGQAPAVKELAGTFTAHINELNIKCLPKDLVHTFEVDISSLVDFHTAIHVKDIVVPEAITVLNDPEDTVANVSAPREEEKEEEVVPAEGEEATAPEGEEKKAEEGDEKSE